MEKRALNNYVSENVDGRKRVKPFLDSMLLESNFTDEEIEDEVQNFMFAVRSDMKEIACRRSKSLKISFCFQGHDTTMTTMAFCLHSLSQHPEIQVCREVSLYLEVPRSKRKCPGGKCTRRCKRFYINSDYTLVTSSSKGNISEN